MIRDQNPRNEAYLDASRWIMREDTSSKSNGEASDLPWKLMFTGLRAFDVEAANYFPAGTSEGSVRRGIVVWKWRKTTLARNAVSHT
jgi:hypothetical protein